MNTNDLISRQAAIDAMEESKTIFHDRKTIIGKMQDIVNNLPSVQGWIPVGERLPPSGEDVIVSLHDDSGDTSFDYTSVGWTTPKGEYWIVGGEINHYVCAWMPMPRAYKRCK